MRPDVLVDRLSVSILRSAQGEGCSLAQPAGFRALLAGHTPAFAAMRWTACSPGLSSRSRPTRTRPATSTGSSRSTPPSSAPTSTLPPPAEKGDPPAGRTRRSRPRPIPRRPDHQNPSRLRRQGTPTRGPADTRPTPRQHLRASPPGTHLRPAHRPGPASLQARPGHRRQGLQLPRVPRLPAQTRHRLHHPGESRPAATPAQPRPSRRAATGLRPSHL